VNKKPVPKKSVGKMENLKGEGSRGVVIFPGDIVQFGASTRVFVLDGPSNFNRGSLKALQQQQQQMQIQQIQQQTHHSLQSNDICKEGITWGIHFHDGHDDDNDDDEDDDQNGKRLLDDGRDSSFQNIQTFSHHVHTETDIPEKHQKLYNTIQGKKYKLSNIQNEMQRIQSKAVTMELTSGQIKQLESLEQRETGLLQEISDLEMTLREKMEENSKQHSLKSQKRQSRVQGSDDDDDDDDDDVDGFYDKTATNHHHSHHHHHQSKRLKLHDTKNHPQVVETEESLISKCKALFLQYQSGKHKISQLMSRVIGLRKKLDAMNPQDEDYFYTKNDLDLIMDEHGKAIGMISNVEEEIDEIQRLLKVVNENIIVDRDQLFVGYKVQHGKAGKKPEDELNNDASAMPAPDISTRSISVVEKQNITTQSVLQEQVVHSNQPAVEPPKVLMPPPPPPTIANATSTTTATAASTTAPPPPPPPLQSSSSSSQPPLRKIRGPARPRPHDGAATLDFLSWSSTSTVPTQKSKDTLANTTHRTDISSNHSLDDSKTDHWVVPSSQDGSGFTKLNEKFRGRY
jgi:hypothetical protein